MTSSWILHSVHTWIASLYKRCSESFFFLQFCYVLVLSYGLSSCTRVNPTFSFQNIQIIRNVLPYPLLGIGTKHSSCQWYSGRKYITSGTPWTELYGDLEILWLFQWSFTLSKSSWRSFEKQNHKYSIWRVFPTQKEIHNQPCLWKGLSTSLIYFAWKRTTTPQFVDLQMIRLHLFSTTQLSQILSWASPMPQKLQNIANTFWLVFQREWMFGKEREKVVGSGNEQNSIQSLRRNAHARCVLFICNVRIFYLQHLFYLQRAPCGPS